MMLVPKILYSDNNEPANITNALRKRAPSHKGPLNNNGKADYYWIKLDNKQHMNERKQFAEALGDLDGLEEQLHRHLGECDELTLSVEGIPYVTDSGVMVYELVEGRLRKRHRFDKSPYLWQRWEALKWSLIHKCGIVVVEPRDWIQTVEYLIADFKASYEPEHTTLRRYTIPHIAQMSKNPHIDNLMRLHGLRIGEATAKRLVQRFGTLANVFKASEPELIAVMGKPWVDNFIKVATK